MAHQDLFLGSILGPLCPLSGFSKDVGRWADAQCSMGTVDDEAD